MNAHLSVDCWRSCEKRIAYVIPELLWCNEQCLERLILAQIRKSIISIECKQSPKRFIIIQLNFRKQKWIFLYCVNWISISRSLSNSHGISKRKEMWTSGEKFLSFHSIFICRDLLTKCLESLTGSERIWGKKRVENMKFLAHLKNTFTLQMNILYTSNT